ncbi:protein of unknown function (plasmid) [Cupriavidus taiwanensis]|nr:protein of unknown function [Cupriavidus taiwanensis]
MIDEAVKSGARQALAWPQPGVVLGYHVDAHDGERSVLLLVHDPGHLQPQAGSQRGARERIGQPCQRTAVAGLFAREDRRPAAGAGAAFGQRQRHERRDDAGDDGLPGRAALIQSSTCEQ